MTTHELIEKLRNHLVPGGAEPVVQLQIGSYGFMDYNAVQAAIDRLEHLFMMSGALGEKANALEAIGIRVLLDSIYYEWDKKTNEKDQTTE